MNRTGKSDRDHLEIAFVSLVIFMAILALGVQIGIYKGRAMAEVEIANEQVRSFAGNHQVITEG